MITLEITLNDGTVKLVDVEHYDSQEFVEELNDHTTFMVAVGNVIINKNMIRMIDPIEEQTTTE